MAAEAVGIDTEFVWTNTYYPCFGLLQLAYDREHCILVDPTTITETAPFRELLESPNVVKVFHEAASDLPILHRWCGALAVHVVDTRIAGGFCGLTGRMSLAKLLQNRLSVHLEKSETRTDWLQRPLTEAQLAYAGEDVIYLPELWKSLASMLESFGNLERFLDEMSVYAKAEFYDEPAPEEYWKRASRPKYLHFTLQDIAVFQRLLAWRERTARENNITRNRILKDQTLAVMAVKHPYTMDEICGTIGIWPRSARKYGEEIIGIVKSAMKLPKEEWPLQKMTKVDSLMVRNYSDRLLALATKRAEAHGIEPSFVCSRHDASWLVHTVFEGGDEASSPLLKGWRRELLGESLSEILAEMKRKRKL